MKPLVWMTSALICLLSPFAHAGGEGSGGGGNVLVCSENKPWLAKKVKVVYLLDTYKEISAARRANSRLLKRSGGVVYQAIRKALNQSEPGLGELFVNTLDKLDWKPVKNLKLLGDDGFTDKIPDCTKMQIVVQEIKTGKIRYRHDLFVKLTPLERQLLHLHEVLIHLRGKPGLTTPIRNRVSALLSQDLYSKLVRPTLEQDEVWDIDGKEALDDWQTLLYSAYRSSMNLSKEQLSKKDFLRLSPDSLRSKRNAFIRIIENRTDKDDVYLDGEKFREVLNEPIREWATFQELADFLAKHSIFFYSMHDNAAEVILWRNRFK